MRGPFTVQYLALMNSKVARLCGAHWTAKDLPDVPTRERKGFRTTRTKKMFSPELRTGAVQMVQDHQTVHGLPWAITPARTSRRGYPLLLRHMAGTHLPGGSAAKRARDTSTQDPDSAGAKTRLFRVIASKCSPNTLWRQSLEFCFSGRNGERRCQRISRTMRKPWPTSAALMVSRVLSCLDQRPG